MADFDEPYMPQSPEEFYDQVKWKILQEIRRHDLPLPKGFRVGISHPIQVPTETLLRFGADLNYIKNVIYQLDQDDHAIRWKFHAEYFTIGIIQPKFNELYENYRKKTNLHEKNSKPVSAIKKSDHTDSGLSYREENDHVFFSYRGKISIAKKKNHQWVQTLTYLIRRKKEGVKPVKFQDVWDNLVEIEKDKPGFFSERPIADKTKNDIRKSVLRHRDAINKNFRSVFSLGKSMVCEVADSKDELILLI